jgi:putative intracellular protease/amidase
VEIAIPLYERFTALDAVGPYEVLSRLPGARVRFIARDAGPVVTDNGMLTLLAEASLDDVPSPDVVLVPGGTGTWDALSDEELVSWMSSAHATSDWTTSVCTGSLLLGAAGLLDGLTATTHWAARGGLEQFGATPVAERVVEHGKIVMAAGVSAGIDMALVLAARIAGEETAKAIQLGIEYDPDPPFDVGSLEKAPESVVSTLQSMLTRG